jgi:general secretion pathway protein M
MNLALPNGRNGQVLALALTAAVAAAIWFGAISPLRDWYAQRDEHVAARRALAVRMARLAATLPELRATAGAAEAPAAAVELLEGDTDAIAAANLQQRVQALASAAGAAISSAEVLPVEHDGSATAPQDDRPIRLRLSLEAGWPVLMQLLVAIETGPPLMLIDDLRLEGSRAVLRASVPPMQASLTVTGFRHVGSAAPAATGPQAAPGSP